ncbi:hypothetical protein ANCDUO_04635, partial [Ancylostoma duodenale]
MDSVEWKTAIYLNKNYEISVQCEDQKLAETPDRRSVADLRRQITSRLEMKTPDSSLPSRTDASNSPVPRRNFTSNFIKVHEGADPDKQKPYFGRVIDGPVPANKYFQGVMPTSLMQCPSPVPHSAPDAKPPPPAKPTKRNSFLNRLARESSPVEVMPPIPQEETPAPTRPEERPFVAEQPRTQAFAPRPEERPVPVIPQEEPKLNHVPAPIQELNPSTPTFAKTPFKERSFDTVFGLASVEKSSYSETKTMSNGYEEAKPLNNAPETETRPVQIENR